MYLSLFDQIAHKYSEGMLLSELGGLSEIARPEPLPLPAGLGFGFELDRLSKLWLPRGLCRSPEPPAVVKINFSVDMTMDCYSEVTYEAFQKKMAAWLLEGIDPSLKAPSPLGACTNTSSTAAAPTLESLSEFAKKHFPTKPPALPWYLAQPFMLFEPVEQENHFKKAMLYAMQAASYIAPIPPLSPLLANDFLGACVPGNKSRAEQINEQDVLRGIAGDQAEYVWSETLQAHVRIGESLKPKRSLFPKN